MSKWLRETPTWEKIKELFIDTAGQNPENVIGLQPVKINEIVYKRLPFKAKVNDQRLRGMNKYFSRGLGPLISILDNLIRFKAGVGLKGQDVELSDKTVKLKLTKSKLDIQAIRISLNKAVRILSLGNAVCLQKRKSNWKPYPDRKYHHLVQTSNPVTSELLGADLETKINEFNKMNEASRRLAIRHNNKFSRNVRGAQYQKRKKFRPRSTEAQQPRTAYFKQYQRNDKFYDRNRSVRARGHNNFHARSRAGRSYFQQQNRRNFKCQ